MSGHFSLSLGNNLQELLIRLLGNFFRGKIQALLAHALAMAGLPLPSAP